jgi:hypothetical protein
MRFTTTICTILLIVTLTILPANAGTPVCGLIQGVIPANYLAGTNKCSLCSSGRTDPIFVLRGQQHVGSWTTAQISFGN